MTLAPVEETNIDQGLTACITSLGGFANEPAPTPEELNAADDNCPHITN